MPTETPTTPTRYAFTTDPHNFIVNEVKVYGDSSTKKGEVYYKPVAYYGTLELALMGMMHRCQLMDVGSSPKDIMDLLTDHKKELSVAVKEFGIYRAGQVKAENERAALLAAQKK
jgi:hypothetical protein